MSREIQRSPTVIFYNLEGRCNLQRFLIALSDIRAAEACFPTTVHNLTNYFPALCFLDGRFFKLQTEREQKCLFHLRQKNFFYQMTFILVCMYCPKIKVGKYKLLKLQHNQYNLLPFPKSYCEYYRNLK